MNFKQHVLPEIEVDAFQVKETLRILLHTILFNRALGPVTPREYDSDLFDITYVRCGSVEADKTIEEKIELFVQSTKHVSSSELHRGQVLLSFYERKVKRSFLGLLPSEEKIYWEQWVFPVLINKRSRTGGASGSPGAVDSERRQLVTENSLKTNMFKIIELINKERDHVPDVNLNSKEPEVFSYEITIPSQEKAGSVKSGWYTRSKDKY